VLFEPRRAFRAQSQPHRSLADGRRLERGGFQDHRLGIGADLAIRPAHDAGQRNRALAIGNHAIVRLQRARLTVQRRQCLALNRAAHPDEPAAHVPRIEGMKRIARFEHH